VRKIDTQSEEDIIYPKKEISTSEALYELLVLILETLEIPTHFSEGMDFLEQRMQYLKLGRENIKTMFDSSDDDMGKAGAATHNVRGNEGSRVSAKRGRGAEEEVEESALPVVSSTKRPRGRPPQNTAEQSSDETEARSRKGKVSAWNMYVKYHRTEMANTHEHRNRGELMSIMNSYFRKLTAVEKGTYQQLADEQNANSKTLQAETPKPQAETPKPRRKKRAGRFTASKSRTAAEKAVKKQAVLQAASFEPPSFVPREKSTGGVKAPYIISTCVSKTDKTKTVVEIAMPTPYQDLCLEDYPLYSVCLIKILIDHFHDKLIIIQDLLRCLGAIGNMMEDVRITDFESMWDCFVTNNFKLSPQTTFSFKSKQHRAAAVSIYNDSNWTDEINYSHDDADARDASPEESEEESDAESAKGGDTEPDDEDE